MPFIEVSRDISVFILYNWSLICLYKVVAGENLPILLFIEVA